MGMIWSLCLVESSEKSQPLSRLHVHLIFLPFLVFGADIDVIFHSLLINNGWQWF